MLAVGSQIISYQKRFRLKSGMAAAHKRMPQGEEAILPSTAQRGVPLTGTEAHRLAFTPDDDNGRGCIVQGYNAQLAVDSETQVIVAAEVTQQVLDRGQLLTMMESAEHNLGKRPDVITADAGYWDTETVQKAIQSGIQVLMPPDGAATLKTRQPRQMANDPLAQSMRADLATDAGRALYRRRQSYRRTGDRLHQSGPRLPAFCATGPERRARRVADHLHYSQSA